MKLRSFYLRYFSVIVFFALVMMTHTACTLEKDIDTLRKQAWASIMNTVKYDLNGGSGTTPAARNESYHSGITLPGGSGFSRTGYTFGGWNTKADGTGKKYNGGASYTITGNVTLYAQWDVETDTVTGTETYTVTFNANGGIGTAPEARTVNAGYTITLPGGSGLSNPGYTFGGWNTKADGTGTNYNGGASYTITRNITLYAKWNIVTETGTETYTVTFNANGGIGAPSARTVNAGNSIILPGGGGLSKTGYTFGGWNTNESGTGTTYSVGASYTPAGNITLYAKWIYTVTFELNGGSGTTPSAQTASAGSSITLPYGSGLSRTGYTFGGWNTNSSGTGTSYSGGASYTVTGNVTLYAKWIEEVVTTIEIEMVEVSGGNFEMGRNLGTVSSSDVTPVVHTVTVSGFSMSKYQVTQAQYQAVMGSNPSYFSSSPATGEIRNRRPVESVSWYDALVFCNKLSTNEGLTPAYRINNSTDPTAWGSVPTYSDSTWNAVEVVGGSTGYRLPTEAQWEYAAKGGNTGETFTYSGSDDPDAVAWYSGNSNSMTHEVGKKAANGLDLYDMSGNVWEWCWDWYDGYSSEAQTDPQGASSGARRVLRGGCWFASAEGVRSAYRSNDDPSDRDNRIGFRLARPDQ